MLQSDLGGTGESVNLESTKNNTGFRGMAVDVDWGPLVDILCVVTYVFQPHLRVPYYIHESHLADAFGFGESAPGALAMTNSETDPIVNCPGMPAACNATTELGGPCSWAHRVPCTQKMLPVRMSM